MLAKAKTIEAASFLPACLHACNRRAAGAAAGAAGGEAAIATAVGTAAALAAATATALSRRVVRTTSWVEGVSEAAAAPAVGGAASIGTTIECLQKCLKQCRVGVVVSVHADSRYTSSHHTARAAYSARRTHSHAHLSTTENTTTTSAARAAAAAGAAAAAASAGEGAAAAAVRLYAVDNGRRWITSMPTRVSLGGSRRVLLFTTASRRKGVKVENMTALSKRYNQLPFLLFGLGTSVTRSNNEKRHMAHSNSLLSPSRLSMLSVAGSSREDVVGLEFLNYILQRQAAAHTEDSCSSSKVCSMTLEQIGARSPYITPVSTRMMIRGYNNFHGGNLFLSANHFITTGAAEAAGTGPAAAAQVHRSSSTASYISSSLLPYLLLARSSLDVADCGLSVARLLHAYKLTEKALIVCYGSSELPLGFFSLEEGETTVATSDVEEAKKRAAQAGVNYYYGKVATDECSSVALRSVERAIGAPDFLRLRFGVRQDCGVGRTSSGGKQLFWGAISEKEADFFHKEVFPYALELLEKLLLPSEAVCTDVLRLRPQYPLEEGSRKKPVDRNRSKRNFLNKIYRRMDSK